jgi:calcineurin-like phosphoesterase family protein
MKEKEIKREKVWFVSDLHFSHRNILKFQKIRQDVLGFTLEDPDAIKKMNDYMIELWNSQVSKRDRVYILGDLSFGTSEDVKKLLGKLNGNKILIRGNHDASTFGLENYFSEVRELKTITFKKAMFPFLEENMTCVLCHFPLFTWDRRTHGSIMVHGHCHGGIDKINHESQELRVDVGIDGGLCEFVRFVELEDLYNFMKSKTNGQTFQEYIDEKMEKDGFRM